MIFIKTLQTVDIFIVIRRLIITLTVYYYIIYYLYFGTFIITIIIKKCQVPHYIIWYISFIDWTLLLLYRILYDIILRIVIGRNRVIHY